jgi:nucleotide-binding universal stress UspA family protein
LTLQASHAADRYLERTAGRLQGKVEWCAWRVERGDPARVIRSLARHDTLVVIATPGYGDFRRGHLGSVAEAIARGGSTSVLLWCAAVHAECQSEPVAAAARGV